MKKETNPVSATILQLAESLSDSERRELAKQIMPKTNRKLLTSKQAAEVLACHPETVKRMARKGELTAIRIGKRKLRFDAAEIQHLHDFGNGGA